MVMTYHELPFLFQYRPTRAERNTLLWLGLTAVAVVGVFSSFFALGLSIALYDWRLIIGVLTVSALAWYGFGWALVLRKFNRILITPVGLEMRHYTHPFRRREDWQAAHLSAIGITQAEDGGWEIGIFGREPGQYAFRRFYLDKAATDMLDSLEELCQVHGLRFLSTRSEYVAFVNQTGILHDMP